MEAAIHEEKIVSKLTLIDFVFGSIWRSSKIPRKKIKISKIFMCKLSVKIGNQIMYQFEIISCEQYVIHIYETISIAALE